MSEYRISSFHLTLTDENLPVRDGFQVIAPDGKVVFSGDGEEGLRKAEQIADAYNAPILRQRVIELEAESEIAKQRLANAQVHIGYLQAALEDIGGLPSTYLKVARVKEIVKRALKFSPTSSLDNAPLAHMGITFTRHEIEWLANHWNGMAYALKKSEGVLHADFIYKLRVWGVSDDGKTKFYSLKEEYDTPENNAVIKQRRIALGK